MTVEERVTNLEKLVSSFIATQSKTNTYNSVDILRNESKTVANKNEIVLTETGLEDIASEVSLQSGAIDELAEIISSMVEE